MKCDKLLPIHVPAELCGERTIAEAFDYYDREPVDEAIAELKQKLHDSEMAKDDAEAANTEYREEIKTLKTENERLLNENSCKFYKDCLRVRNYEQELNATKRALWLMTAEWAEAMGLASCNIANKFTSRENFEVGDDYRNKTIKKYRHRQVVFYKYADYCRAKAENPQNPQARNKKPLRRDVIRGERIDEDCKRAHVTVEYGKCLCYGLLDNAENTLDKCKKCKAYVWNDDDVNGIKEAK